MAATDTPTRPTGVEVRRASGEVIQCEPAYVGDTEDGTHVWEVITPVGPGDTLHIGWLPAGTAVTLPSTDGGVA